MEMLHYTQTQIVYKLCSRNDVIINTVENNQIAKLSQDGGGMG